MSKLQLSVAVGNYDRMRPLVDGAVQIDGVGPVFMLRDPEEIFFWAFRHTSIYNGSTRRAVSPGMHGESQNLK